MSQYPIYVSEPITEMTCHKTAPWRRKVLMTSHLFSAPLNFGSTHLNIHLPTSTSADRFCLVSQLFQDNDNKSWNCSCLQQLVAVWERNASIRHCYQKWQNPKLCVVVDKKKKVWQAHDVTISQAPSWKYPHPESTPRSHETSSLVRFTRSNVSPKWPSLLKLWVKPSASDSQKYLQEPYRLCGMLKGMKAKRNLLLEQYSAHCSIWLIFSFKGSRYSDLGR